MNAREKIEKLKALRGTHDQTMRCGVINILYEDQIGRYQNVTKAFLEDAILMLMEQDYATGRKPVMVTHSGGMFMAEEEERAKGPFRLWQPGTGDDGK